MTLTGEGNRKVLIIGGWQHPPHTLKTLWKRATGGDVYHDCWVANDATNVSAVKPAAILVMGRELGNAWLNDNMMRWRGRPTVINGTPGIYTLSPFDLKPRMAKTLVIAGLRKPASFTGVVMMDMVKVLEVAASGGVLVGPQHYTHIVDPQVSLFKETAHALGLLGNDLLPFAWDIETTWGIEKDAMIVSEREIDDEVEDVDLSNCPITRISFAVNGRCGISVPWMGGYVGVVKEILSNSATKYGWNCNGFDIPVTEAQLGIEINNGIDLMWAWHMFQSDLPMGLEFVSSFFSNTAPWKHVKGTEFGWYSAHDSAVTMEIAGPLMLLLKKHNLMQRFDEHHTELHKYLKLAGRRGNLIDHNAQATLKEKLKAIAAKLKDDAQHVVPIEVRPLGQTKMKKGDEGLWVQVGTEKKVKFCGDCGAEKPLKEHFKEFTKAEKAAAKAQLPLTDLLAFADEPCNPANVKEEERIVPAFKEILPYNLGSVAQLKNYARWAKHPMGQNEEGKETLDKHQLKKLAKWYGQKHPVYQLTLDYREATKTLGTYVEGFKPDKDGLIHTTFTDTPSTMRLASRSVAMQNISKHSKNPLVKEVRRTIVARPGHIFVQADSSAIEAKFTGYFVGSETYSQLADLGIHDYMSCIELGWHFNEENVKKVKSEQVAVRDRNKRVIHGTNYGMSVRQMCNIYPETFPKESDAKKAQLAYLSVFPDLVKWHEKIRELAFQQTYLQNPWGYRHYFYDVYHVGVDGKARLGDDSKRAIAYLPQSSAGCFARDNLIMLGRQGWGNWMGANCTVHDSYCLEVPVEMAWDAVKALVNILTRPIPEMGNIRVGCEVEMGYNWRDMDTVVAQKIYTWEDWNAKAA